MFIYLLTNIIWGEASESDDHIVPYPDENKQKPPVSHGNHIKMEWKQEAANVKPAEQKRPVAGTDFHGGKLENDSQCGTNEGLPGTGFGMDSWPDLSVSNDAKTDQDSMGTEASTSLTEIFKYDSLRGDYTAGVDNGSEIFQAQHEEREEGDFVDYGWANIGSFDDLDRIFCDQDPIFGHIGLGNADELWSSSKDVNATTSPNKSIPLSMDSRSLGLGALRSASENFEVKIEYILDQDQSFTPGFDKMNDLTSHAPQNVQASMDQIGYAEDKSKLLLKDKTAVEMVGKTPSFNSHLNAAILTPLSELSDKVSRQNKSLKGWKKSEEKGEDRQLQAFCGTWSPSGNQLQRFDGHCASPMGQPCPSPILSQQRRLQGPEVSQHKHFSNPLLAPVAGNLALPYPAMTVVTQFNSSEGSHQSVPSGYEVSPSGSNPSNMSPDTTMKPLAMTPMEKIEKLRRCQQMRAMLAIQKQQQQFSGQVSCTEPSIAQCSHENQMQLLMEGGNTEAEENLSTLPLLDPTSPIEQDDSNAVSKAIDDFSAVDAILYQLQDIIAKLDVRIRLCIQDSLFRLAQSATQRQYASDTSSTNKTSRDELEIFTEEEINSHNRFARKPDVETETNPIDRMVAHLLFHRPLEFSETPESPLSSKFTRERKAMCLMSLPEGVSPESIKNKQTLSYQGKIPCLFAEGEHSKGSSRVDNSENASTTEVADGEARGG